MNSLLPIHVDVSITYSDLPSGHLSRTDDYVCGILRASRVACFSLRLRNASDCTLLVNDISLKVPSEAHLGFIAEIPGNPRSSYISFDPADLKKAPWVLAPSGQTSSSLGAHQDIINQKLYIALPISWRGGDVIFALQVETTTATICRFADLVWRVLPDPEEI